MGFLLIVDDYQFLLFRIIYHYYAVKFFEYPINISQIFNNLNYSFSCLYVQPLHWDIDQKLKQLAHFFNYSILKEIKVQHDLHLLSMSDSQTTPHHWN